MSLNDSKEIIQKCSLNSYHPSISSLNSKRGLVLINSMGEYYHGVELDYLKKIKENKNNIGTNYNMEEVDLGNIERIEEYISQYKILSVILLILLLGQLFIDGLYIFLDYENKDRTLLEMKKFYQQLQYNELNLFYWFVNIIQYIFDIVYYIYGFLSIFQKKINLLDTYNLICLVGLLIQMMQAYIQNFNFIIFIGRCIAFFISKNLIDLLIKIMYFIVHF